MAQLKRFVYTKDVLELTKIINSIEATSWFKSWHRFVIPRSKIGTRLLQFFSVIVILPVFAGVYVMWQAPADYFPLFDQIARMTGQISAVFYGLTLLPGIMRRFGVLPLSRSILMLWRRHIGIAMFHSAITHQLLIRTIPLAFINPGLLSLYPGRQIMFGLFGLMILFPLWITSNDWSVKRLGRWWHNVHALTYIALFLIYLHVALVSIGWVRTYLLIIMVLEILSFIVKFISKAGGENEATS